MGLKPRAQFTIELLVRTGVRRLPLAGARWNVPTSLCEGEALQGLLHAIVISS